MYFKFSQNYRHNSSQLRYLNSSSINVIMSYLGDGTIDLDEFLSVYTSYGITEEECRKAYDRFTNVSTTTY